MRMLVWAVAGVAAAAGMVVLFLYEPQQVRFLPKCVFYEATGLFCPGCGSTRASHELLHGNVSAAAAFNPLLVALIPLFLAEGALAAFAAIRGCRRLSLFANRAVSWVVVVAVIGFFIARNVPAYPFTVLAPGVSLAAKPPR
jgi:hypothetical protein